MCECLGVRTTAQAGEFSSRRFSLSDKKCTIDWIVIVKSCLNQWGGNGGGNCKVDDVSDTLAIMNMVMTGTGKRGDLLVRDRVKLKIKRRSLAEVVGKIGCAPARERKRRDDYFA